LIPEEIEWQVLIVAVLEKCDIRSPFCFDILDTAKAYKDFHLKLYALYILVGYRRMIFNVAPATPIQGKYNCKIRARRS
jgi:hypothetical protein